MFKNLVSILCSVVIVLLIACCVKYYNQSNSEQSNNEDISNNICESLKKGFFNSSNTIWNYSSCKEISNTELEFAAWSSNEDKGQYLQFNDENVPDRLADALCDVFFKSFPNLKLVKFNLLAKDQESVAMEFLITPKVCNKGIKID